MRRWTRIALTGAMLVAAPTSLAAQDEGGAWKLDGELGASLFFGASEQTTTTFRAAAERKSSLLEFSLGGEFAYGEAQDPASGDSFVNKRSWAASTALDYKPEGKVSPFLFADAEGSLERQIALRLSTGLGAKYRFVDTDETGLDVSLAALVERTEPREYQVGADTDIETLARWSARFRARHAFSDGRTTFKLVTFYRPAFRDSGDYTVDTDTSLAYALNQSISLKLSFVDKYDSLARDRGARSNNDGRLVFSVLASVK